jgi:hypothetical protein
VSEALRVGIPKSPPNIPAGWMLRTSLFNYPAAISPEGAEWLIDPGGLLHEVRQGPKAERWFTGRTQVVAPPFGTGRVEDRLKEVLT